MTAELTLVPLPPGVHPITDDRLLLADNSSKKVYGYCPHSQTFCIKFWPAEDGWLTVQCDFSTALWLLSIYEATEAKFDLHARLEWVDFVMSHLPPPSVIFQSPGDGKQ